MPSLLRALAPLALFALLLPGCCSSDPGPARDEIQTLFNGVAAAFDMKDVDAIAAAATPDATLKFLDGATMSVAEWKEGARKDFATLAAMRSEFKVESVELRGDSARVVFTETHDYTVTLDPNHKYSSVSRWRAEVAKTPQGWRAKRFEQLTGAMARDGQPISPAKR
jgi:ketosteroid isomerase-like protein